jgi:tetratricopeptide (TPR) repeat protein
VSYNKVGDVLVAQGNLTEALKSFRDGLAIAERLAKADPSNARWQRDLAMSSAKLARAYRRLGNVPEALAELHKGREIMAALVKLAPDFLQWTKDIAWFDREIAALQGATTGTN